MTEELNRVVELEDGTSVYIVDASASILQGADTEYTKAWNRAIADGAKLEREMEKFLAERNHWTSEDQAKLTSMQEERENYLKVLREGGCSLSQARDAALKSLDVYESMILLATTKTQYNAMTIESRADNAYRDYLVSQCAVYNNDRKKKYFQNYEDYLNRKKDLDAQRITAKFSEIYWGVGHLAMTEEQEFLQKYGFLDEDLNFIDREGRKVNRDGDLIDEDGRRYKLTKTGKKTYLDKKVEFKPFLDEEGKPVEV